jgi:preprotein translocase subunit Sec63
MSLHRGVDISKRPGLLGVGAVSPESQTISLEEAELSWREILGVSANADTPAARRAITRLAIRYHPNKGGRPEQMTRINTAYESARPAVSARR